MFAQVACFDVKLSREHSSLRDDHVAAQPLATMRISQLKQEAQQPPTEDGCRNPRHTAA